MRLVMTEYITQLPSFTASVCVGDAHEYLAIHTAEATRASSNSGAVISCRGGDT